MKIEWEAKAQRKKSGHQTIAFLKYHSGSISKRVLKIPFQE